MVAALTFAGLAASAQDSALDRVSSGPIPRKEGKQQFGNVIYAVPEGWRRVDANGAAFLEPENLGAGQVCRIMIPTGGELKGDFRAQFEQLIQGMRAGVKGTVTDAGQIEPRKGAGGIDAFSNVCNITREDGSQWTIFVMAFHPGSRFESVAFLVNPPDLYEKYGDAVNALLANIRFAAEEEAKAAVLAQGEPPLTQEMVDRYNLLFEWLLDVQTTQEQRQIIHDYLVQTWQAKNKSDIDGAMNVINGQKQIEQRPEAEKEVLRQQLQSKFLDALRQQPDSPAAKWVFSLYDTAHKPVAQGAPPLTRQMSDAFLEVLAFMRNEVVGGQPIYANAAMKDEFVKGLAAAYVKSDAARQKHIAGMPLFWAALRAEWPKLAESEKAKYRQLWKGYLQQIAPEFLTWKPAVPTRAQQAQLQARKERIEQSGDNLTEAEKRARAQQWYAQEMARMQSSHNTYMMMSNMSLMNHVTNMNMIGNIGSSGWRYEYKYVNR
jgi:hypothetical protein